MQRTTLRVARCVSATWRARGTGNGCGAYFGYGRGPDPVPGVMRAGDPSHVVSRARGAGLERGGVGVILGIRSRSAFPAVRTAPWCSEQRGEGVPPNNHLRCGDATGGRVTGRSSRATDDAWGFSCGDSVLGRALRTAESRNIGRCCCGCSATRLRSHATRRKSRPIPRVNRVTRIRGRSRKNGAASAVSHRA